MQYPKFEQKIRDQIVDPANYQGQTPGYGIILKYDRLDNTATIIMSMPGSDQIGQFYTGVPCPTNSGVQGVAPEIGRQCWVVFRDGTQAAPMITHFFNYIYESTDYEKQYQADISMPRFMLEM